MPKLTYLYVSSTVKADQYASNVGLKKVSLTTKLLDHKGVGKVEQYDSADFAPVNITASELDDKGLNFVYRGIRSEDGKFGVFYALDCLVGDEEKELLFSSKKLAAIFKKHGEDFMGKEINLSGYDEGVNRKYKVKVVQTTL